MPRFFNPLLGLRISWSNSLSRVWFITWKGQLSLTLFSVTNKLTKHKNAAIYLWTYANQYICCGSILSLVQFLFSFVFCVWQCIYDSEHKTKERIKLNHRLHIYIQVYNFNLHFNHKIFFTCHLHSRFLLKINFGKFVYLISCKSLY